MEAIKIINSRRRQELLVSVGLFLIFLFSEFVVYKVFYSPQGIWLFLLPTIIWSISLMFHAFNTFVSIPRDILLIELELKKRAIGQ